jgi:hypothetical protein
MASVQLSREEAHKGLLPHICLCCGAPAVQALDKVFWWWPEGEVGWGRGFWEAVEYLLSPLWASKHVRVRVPLCAGHRNYWWPRLWFIYAGSVLFVMMWPALAVAWMQR